jgi:hypothetical protein
MVRRSVHAPYIGPKLLISTVFSHLVAAAVTFGGITWSK